jgi:hypothetical protein
MNTQEQQVIKAIGVQCLQVKQIQTRTGYTLASVRTLLDGLQRAGHVRKSGSRYELTGVGLQVLETKADPQPMHGKDRPGQTQVQGVLEVDHARGVLYFHAAEGPWAGCSLLRVCGLGEVPKDVQVDVSVRDPDGQVMFSKVRHPGDPGPIEELSVEDLGGEDVLKAAGLEVADNPSKGTLFLHALDELCRVASNTAVDAYKAGSEDAVNAQLMRRQATDEANNAKRAFVGKLKELGAFPQAPLGKDPKVVREVVYKTLLRTHGDGMATENLSTIADMVVEALAREV